MAITSSVSYRQQTRRCKNYDYGSNGLYFVTLNTLHKQSFFGHIVTTDNCSSLLQSPIGVITNEYWLQIPEHYPFVELDTYTMMLNHLHGILRFKNPDKKNFSPNVFGPQSRNLGAVIRAFKSSVKRSANVNDIPFAWQPGYHDRIIRTDDELFNTRNYIMLNQNRSA